jgi:phage baseplate assembly protein W
MDENESNQTYTSFLGTGWSFPPEFVLETGEVLMTSDEEDIQASLRILLGTALGERFLNPKYGLDLHEMLFEPMSTTMTTFLKDRAKTTILIYEPRINLLSLELDTSAQTEGKVSIIVDYEVRATNSRFNLVYPFYSTEASEVRASALLSIS